MRNPLPILDVSTVPELVEAINTRFRAMTSATAAGDAAAAAASTAAGTDTPTVIGDTVTIDDVPVTY